MEYFTSFFAHIMYCVMYGHIDGPEFEAWILKRSEVFLLSVVKTGQECLALFVCEKTQ